MSASLQALPSCPQMRRGPSPFSLPSCPQMSFLSCLKFPFAFLSEIPLCLSLIGTLIIRLPWIIWGDHIPRSSTYKHLQRHFSQTNLHSWVLGRPIFWGTTVQPVTVLDNVSLKKYLHFDLGQWGYSPLLDSLGKF